jgi:hypothetical protein
MLGIALVGMIALLCDRAGAAGGPGAFLSRFGATPRAEGMSETFEAPIISRPRRRLTATLSRASSHASGQAVCVRLCDGYFFPVNPGESGSAADGQTACADLCPSAATALYFLPAGSDRIEDASSPAGARYTALSTALRYRTTLDNACTCHATPARTKPYWRDPTLRKGDAVMTVAGLVIYQGGAQRPENFTRLAAAPMSRARRAELAALDSATALAVPAPSAKTDTASETGSPPTTN